MVLPTMSLRIHGPMNHCTTNRIKMGTSVQVLLACGVVYVLILPVGSATGARMAFAD
jgi:hypothetical protein